MWPLAARFQLLTSPVICRSRSSPSPSMSSEMWSVRAETVMGFMGLRAPSALELRNESTI